LKIVFMGTPDFAVGCLKELYKAGHEIAAVVTQPDKPKGRGKELAMPPVKELAISLGLTVYQPLKAKNPEFIDIIRKINPEAIVVVAFGQILSKELLDIPKYGCINVHASLLPKYRGAAPIQWAVIDGQKESGVTTMLMDVGVDTGDILMKSVRQLDSKETGGSLFDKLSEDGAKLIVKTLEGLEKGTVTRTPQDSSAATHAKMLDKSIGNIDFSMEADKIECLIRGLNPWPSAYTCYKDKTMKIWDADVIDKEYPDAAYGEIVAVSKNDFTVKCGRGALAVREVQLEGKKRMGCDAFLLGTKVTVGEILCQKQ
jgi:methionyl-tRNA formyltransferase